MRSIYPLILEQIRLGSKCVLATGVRTSGSTPQKPGSSALFGEEGLLESEVQSMTAQLVEVRSRKTIAHEG